MSIQPLPPDVVAQIKSSTVITSLNRVVCELVENALDAESTKVNINVDYTRGGCVVEDNGLGILPSEFSPCGGLGKLYRKYLYFLDQVMATIPILTLSRYLEAKCRGHRSWWVRDLSCFCVSYVYTHYNIPSPFAPIPQHHDVA